MSKVLMDWGYDRFTRRHRWTATLPDGERRSHTEWEAIHDMVKSLAPDVKIEYTAAGWSRNVTEFENARHWRR